MLRLVTIVATGTRSLVEAVFGTDKTGKLTYADRAVGALGAGMLLLADRNFAGYRFFAQVTDAGADFLIRAKTNATAMKLPVLARLPDRSYLSAARGVTVGLIGYEHLANPLTFFNRIVDNQQWGRAHSEERPNKWAPPLLRRGNDASASRPGEPCRTC